MNTKALLFDCFGVITERVLGNWVPEGMGHDFDPTDLYTKLDLGEISEDDSVRFFSEKLHRPFEEIRKEIDSHFKPNYELLDLIKKLKEKGYKIVLLTNASHDFFDRFISHAYPQFLESFDDIIISSKVKMIKPNKDIYEYALQKNSLKPGEAVFIDDNQDNIVGAKVLGLPSILYTNVEQLKKDFETIGISV